MCPHDCTGRHPAAPIRVLNWQTAPGGQVYGSTVLVSFRSVYKQPEPTALPAGLLHGRGGGGCLKKTYMGCRSRSHTSARGPGTRRGLAGPSWRAGSAAACRCWRPPAPRRRPTSAAAATTGSSRAPAETTAGRWPSRVERTQKARRARI